MPLLGQSSAQRFRSSVTLLATTALLVALVLVAASSSSAAPPQPLALRSSHSPPSIKSEDRFVSAQNAYITSMNGNGGVSAFDLR
jgi:hypothetical protein